MNETIKEQILQVRETGLSNMFNITKVQLIAEQLGLSELSTYLSEDDKKEYVHFIFTAIY